MPLSPLSHFYKTRSRMLTNATFTSKPFFNKVKNVDKFDFHLEAIILTRSRMLIKATFTSKPFFNKVNAVDICDFHLEAMF